MTIDTLNKLDLSYDGETFQGSWTRINLTRDETTGFEVVETEYLDKLLLFVRVHWTEGIPEVYDIVRSLMETGEYHDAYEY